MVYRAIGLMSGSSLDGLDIVFAELHESAGKWGFEIRAADCYPYEGEWQRRLQEAPGLTARDYALLHTAYGHYLGGQVGRFIEENGLHYQVGLIASHGHTTFHLPEEQMTAQLGDGAAIAARTGLPVVSDLRALDVAFGGQGAPIVPIGEKLLLTDYTLFLNLGGIANISVNAPDRYTAFDVCPANRVLNLLAAKEGKEYDAGGGLAARGQVNGKLLEELNRFPYYRRPYPKSLANAFGTDEVFPLVESFNLSTGDALRTYVEHIVLQIRESLQTVMTDAPSDTNPKPETRNPKLLVTGGGAFNTFLVDRLRQELQPLGIELSVPDAALVQYKEALIMALIGVLRWRQEYNVLPTVTGAARGSIGGALWNGQEA